MLTCYDTITAGVFEQAGVGALLVGDTSGQMVLGYPDTVPVTMDQLVPMVQAVVRGTVRTQANLLRSRRAGRSRPQVRCA
jgi:3-methyl-2-oxobutanoate hydroxymethyltransferase